MIRVTIFIIITLILGAVIVPPLLGPVEVLFGPILICSVILFSPSNKLALMYGVIAALLFEFFNSVPPASYLGPTAIMVLLQWWLRHSIDIGYTQEDTLSLFGFLAQSIILLVFVYIFSFLFILRGTGLDFYQTWDHWRHLISLTVLLYNIPVIAIYAYLFKRFQT